MPERRLWCVDSCSHVLLALVDKVENEMLGTFIDRFDAAPDDDDMSCLKIPF